MDYPAKILLFGEYGILMNSMALAIPCPLFSGRFRFSGTSASEQTNKEIELNEQLKKLLTELKSKAKLFEFLNLELFEEEVNQGLYFDSYIPIGFGLGSSGALTAAIYERYFCYSKNNEYQTIKSNLAALENCFSINSSGFDPLISLLNKPLLKKGQSSNITDVNISNFLNTYTLFLIKAKSKADSNDLNKSFLNRFHLPDFSKIIEDEYIPIINQTIEAVIAKDFVSFDKLVARYSAFQMSNFSQMIQPVLTTHVKYGISSGEFHLKICGSGGGGFLIGFTRDRNKTESYLNSNHLDWTVI